jgi:hypothetical protein
MPDLEDRSVEGVARAAVVLDLWRYRDVRKALITGSRWKSKSCGIPSNSGSPSATMHGRSNGMVTPVPRIAVGWAASHGVSIVSSKLFPSILT